MNDKRNNKYKKSPARAGARSGKQFSDGADSGAAGKGGSYNHPGNDYSWWSKYPELLDAAARVSFPYKPGMLIKDAQYYKIATESGKVKETNVLPQAIPGVCTIDWIPNVGISNSVTDPISIVAKEVFSRVRSKYSGTLAVDGPDMVMQIMATDSIFAYLSWLKRVYRTINSISKQNYLFPEKVLHAMGFDDAAILALKSNRMQLYSNINLLIRYAQKIRCPKIFDIMERHTWMSEYLYADSASDMCQIYMFNAKAYYKFGLVDTIGADGQIDTSVQAGGLTYRRILATELQGSNVVDTLFNIGNELLTALTEWEDMYVINGYFERAFEGMPNFTIALLGEDEIITTSYDEDVLMQIENATTVPHGFFGALAIAGGVVVNTVRQQPSTNAIVSNPKAQVLRSGSLIPGNSVDTYLEYGNIDRSFLSIRKDVPDVRDVVQSSRLHCVCDNPVLVEDKHEFAVYAGTEIILNFRLHSVSEYTDARDGAPFGSHVATVNTLADDPSVNLIMPALYNFSTFDWHPLVASLTLNYLPATDTFTVYNHAIHGDVHNLTTIDNELMRQIHFNCLLSAFTAFGL